MSSRALFLSTYQERGKLLEVLASSQVDVSLPKALQLQQE
ncbi:hypothetical protein JCM19231_4846 [Vibrio ishigakensis]|uniref:Uncharacterized protein n=1 Tax=Vibrio ishigakensis TaxID=1481914 RepID=A0A0B8P883_9VIBR|nr:hypothetical protein JCM19231_4846 [Vibrio ishigakensis]